MPKLKLSTLTNSDMEKYYYGGVVRVLGCGGAPVWMGYRHMKGDGSLSLWPSKGKELIIPQEEWKKKLMFHSIFPVGFFNYKDTSVFCSRIPVRNVAQGITGQNFNIELAQGLCLDSGFTTAMPEKYRTHFQQMVAKKKHLTPTADVCNELFEPAKYSSDVIKAMDEVRRGAIFSRALSKDFALMPHPTQTGCTVYHGKFLIGESTTPNKVRSVHPAFKQELMDFFIPRGIPVEGVAA